MPILISLFSLMTLFQPTQSTKCDAIRSKIEKDNILVEIESYKSINIADPVVIFPPTGGKNVLDQFYAKDFCRAGMDVIIMENWTGYDAEGLELNYHNNYYRDAVNALKLVHKNKLENRPFGLLGTSLGGIFTSVSLHQVPKINKAFIIASGVALPEMIVKSKHETMTSLKQKRVKKFGFKNDQEYIDALWPAIPLEPTKNPIDFKSKKLGLFIAKDDQIVGEKYQQILKDLWQPDLVRELESPTFKLLVGQDHKAVIIKSHLQYSKEITDFFLMD